jgi:hypothetical protein
VRIDVPQQEYKLKEKQACRPDICGASEPGKDLLCDDRLDKEEKKRRNDDGKLKVRWF